jgi:hypothetical protein
MRAPRFRFPNEVRSTTRGIAARMVQEERIARSPEELQMWISQTPDVEESLERGGYTTAFTAEDLFPLLQVFVAQAGGPAPEPDVPPRSSRGRWIGAGALLLVLAIVILALVLTSGAAA